MPIHGLKQGIDSKYDLNKSRVRFLPSNLKMDTCKLFSNGINDIKRMKNIANKPRTNFNITICGPFLPHQSTKY